MLLTGEANIIPIWIKMYDKGTVLRVETVINDPEEFRVRRRVRRTARMRWRGCPYERV